MTVLKPKHYQEEIPDYLDEEGSVKLEIAPLPKLPVKVPDEWKGILSADDPVEQVLKTLWLPWLELLPATIEQLAEKIQYIGLLQTDEVPFSLLYCFEDEGEVVYFRGYPCQSINQNEAAKLPVDFLNLYKIHDGWTDITGYMGPLPSQDWFDISELYDDDEPCSLPPEILNGEFLVICDMGGSGYIGFDMSKAPPLGLVYTKDDPVEVSPDIVRSLDEWIAFELGNLENNNSKRLQG